VGPGHTFAGLADAISQGFGRWDLSHLHEFQLVDGQRIGFVDPDWEFEDQRVLEHTAVKVASAVAPGDEFGFVFDFGDRWEHRCRVMSEKVDPREEWGPGPLPRQPVAIWGWGSIPDQYGRRSAAELDLEP
jgi:Plasmid pRiA4b ORF-3-like protein